MGKKRKFSSPDAYVVVFCVIILAYLLTFFIPVGSFTVTEEPYMSGGAEKIRTVVDPDSFQYELDDQGHKVTNRAKLFTDHYAEEGTGVLNAIFNGFVNGGMDGNVGVIAFVLIIGGAFGIVIRTGAVDMGIWKIIDSTKGRDILIIPILMVVFALGGSVLGLAEEVIPFGIVLIPLFVKLGYDSITGLMVVYVATMVGFSTTWMNPFTLVIAQGIAGVPVMSGATLRIVMWTTFLIPLIAFTMIRAKKIRDNPQISVVYDDDNDHFRLDTKEVMEGSQARPPAADQKFLPGHGIVLVIFVAGLAWIFYGVVVEKWFLGQMAAQFTAIGILSGIVGAALKLNGMRINDIAHAFKQGAQDIAPAAMILALAKGITLVMGGTDNAIPNMLNTILHGAGELLSGVPVVFAAVGMYVFQSLFNFLVCSGPAQAGIVMPIMAPLSDILGVERQVACLAFQLGDGLTNMINSTSGVLLAFLGIAKVDFVKWVKWLIKPLCVGFAMAILFIVIAVLIGYN